MELFQKFSVVAEDRTRAGQSLGQRKWASLYDKLNSSQQDQLQRQDGQGCLCQDLKQLNRLLKELGMTFYLEQSRDMTMFMPVDSAFSQLPFNIHELSWQAKWRIVQFHIIPNDIVDLDNELRDESKKDFESWEGAPLQITKEAPKEDEENGVASVEYVVNGEAKVISKPPKIETFNGATYKINRVLLPPSMTEEDLKPAKQEQRINPEVAQRLRRRPATEGTPTVAVEQELASVDGTVQMERSARDPRLPGSFRPDPLAQRSQVTPEFVRGINSQHARWDDSVYHRTPMSQVKDERKPQGTPPGDSPDLSEFLCVHLTLVDEIMGFQQEPEDAEGFEARIKVLGHTEGAVLPTDGSHPAMTRISGTGNLVHYTLNKRPPNTDGHAYILELRTMHLISTPPIERARSTGIGLAFESSENPESAPSDPISQFINVLLGGGSVQPKERVKDEIKNEAPENQQRNTVSATAKKQQGQQREAEPSLFSVALTPTEGPRVQALGLTEGLLPSEELITQHWANRGSKTPAQNARRSGEQQKALPPFASLWNQIQSVP
ncbi:uncharacterized protein LOC34620482 [Cyclospora cayetanensis]|uniref:Uncharacterized protein LOC34620482 n=1 Tax=Cyclospora cayetanensis TaxID=88456 RepID=A0A6P6S1V7_9EIME|nr:uncharacterized protein LOC34620482 [Cyclospora cayetanensis]